MPMTAEEFNEYLTKFHGLVSGDLAKDVVELPARGMFAAIKRRITIEGKNSAGGSIGSYSTKPMYATRAQFVKPSAFKAQGKRNAFGNTIGDKLIPTARLKSTGVKKNKSFYSSYTLVKPNYTIRKSMYLAEGYKELRGVQGLRTDIMNYRYRGDLINDFSIAKVGQQIVMGFTSAKEIAKRRGLDAKRGPVFNPTQQEIQVFAQAVNFGLRRLTVGALQGQIVEASVENIYSSE